MARSAVQIAIEAVEEAHETAPELSLSARKLLSFTGLCNALADLAERAKCGCDRDENASMNVETKVYKEFAAIQAQVLTHQLDAEGTAKLRELEELMGRQDSSASTQFSQGLELPTATNKTPNQN